MRPTQGLRASSARASQERRRRLWVRWTGLNAAATVGGVGAGALVGWALLESLVDTSGQLVAVLLSAVFFGLIAGALVGWAQHGVLIWPLPFVRVRVWLSATALGGIAGWLVVSAVDSLGSDTAAAVRISLGGLIGALVGVVIGLAQSIVLQPHVERFWHWVWANAVAWAVAMAIIFLTLGSVPDGAGWVRVGVTALFGLPVAGAVLGAITGRVLLWLVEDRLHPNSYTIHALEGISQAVAGNDSPLG